MSKPITPAAIVGAGLAGMIAGFAFPGVPILEASSRADVVPHRALLRFRTDAVSRLTGIPFRKVTVRKGIWSRDAYCAPNVQLANLYARKCLDLLVGERSIWNLNAAVRYVAPESLAEQMAEALGGRIAYGVAFDFAAQAAEVCPPKIISTAPMGLALQTLGISPASMPRLARAPIWVDRFRVPACDVHQTVYFPDHDTPVYRASITGDLLIVESRAAPSDDDIDAVCRAMGIPMDLEVMDRGQQRYGKIVELPADERRSWLARLTIEAGIYSLGRFATWRNVLLDDVVNDAEVIRAMLRSAATTNFAALRATAGR